MNVIPLIIVALLGFTFLAHLRHPQRHATAEQRHTIYERDDHRCVYCHAYQDPWQFQSDHATPFARRGRTTTRNLVVACRACNMAKFTMSPREFRRQLRRHGLTWRDKQAALHTPQRDHA